MLHLWVRNYIDGFFFDGIHEIYGTKTSAKNQVCRSYLTINDSFFIGVAQSFALIPGSSRSGTTINGGLFLGLNREAAARFSFLLSIPAVLASGLLELYESLKFLDASMSINLIIATLFSAVSGYAAIDFLLKYLRKNSTFVFIYYRIILGILILLWSNIIHP